MSQEQHSDDSHSAPDFSNSSGSSLSDTSSGGSSVSSIEAAFDRAEQSLRAEKDTGKQASGDSEPIADPSASEQAAASMPSGSASTPTEISDTPAPGENDGTSDQPGADASTPASSKEPKPQSLTPPDSWPKERRQEFETLPAQGKSLLMDIYRDMERGLKQTFDKLAQERKTIQDQFGYDADQLKSLTDQAKSFQNDPVATISQLAEEAGIEVFFKEESEEIPDFDSQQDLVKWLRQKSQHEARQAAADEAKGLRQQQQKAEMKQRLDAEFAEAHRAHPDLADHKDAIIKYISGFNLPVEMAYRLATYEGLTQLAQGGQTTKAELSKVKAELEKLQKLSTMPPGRPDGQSQRVKANRLDPYEAAMQRAEQRLGRKAT